jgi:hypothetical protein
MSGYSFPTMDWQEVEAVVREWGLVELQHSQLSSCDPMVIQNVYTTILRRITGISSTTLDNKASELADEFGDQSVRTMDERRLVLVLT